MVLWSEREVFVTLELEREGFRTTLQQAGYSGYGFHYMSEM
jgi:hypothetical protein